MKIMLTGGGSLGPVTPLMAVAEVWRKEDVRAEFVWIGTPGGPERTVVEAAGIPFHPLFVPKLDRYAPGKWVFIPFRLLWSMKMALHLIQRERPDVVLTAGGYVSVPLIWAAALYGIPTWVHQQDVRPGLANKLMAPFATKISVAWTRSLPAFDKKKTIHIGNPVRDSVLHGSRERGAEQFGFDPSRPTVLVFGGGTGAAWINHAIAQIVPELCVSVNVLHITGRGKQTSVEPRTGYFATELLATEMPDALALADVVVCRAGMGTISELSALAKPAIVIPIPDSHQEDNAAALDELAAAMVIRQAQTTPQMLLQTILSLLENPEDRRKLGARLHAALPTTDVAQKLAHHLEGMVKQKSSV